MTEKIARITILIVGVVLSSYVAATPGDQLVAAALAGACIGTTIVFILMEGE